MKPLGQYTYDKLSKLHGVDFDREYMKQMVKEHKKDIKEFKKEARKGKNTTVRLISA